MIGWSKRKERILVDESGFGFEGMTRNDRYAFADIVEIVAYQRDELTTDLICCDIQLKRADEPITYFVHQEIFGFRTLLEACERLPGFDRTWRERVLLPPFEECRTVVYRSV